MAPLKAVSCKIFSGEQSLRALI